MSENMASISCNFYKIEKFLLYLMVLTTPIDLLPEWYSLPATFRNVHYAILLIAICVASLHFIKNRDFYYKSNNLVKAYLLICFFWTSFCTIIGVLKFPYWNEQANVFLQNTSMVQKIAIFYPNIIHNNELLHLKYCISLILNTFHNIFIPLCGIPFVFYVMFKNKEKREILDVVSRAAFILASVLTLYSLIEIPWLLTENEFCANLLKFINKFLYDANSNDWWPPLLWKNQLRSFTYEPAFFGIIAMFILPMLWYRAFQLKEKKVLILLVLFTCMIFFTRSRTAQVVLLGEIGLLLLLSVYGKYKCWISHITAIIILTMFSFFIFLSAPITVSFFSESEIDSSMSVESMAYHYYKNDVSSIGIENTRSNIARWGNMIATFNVGMSHPILGVGAGLQHMYIADNIPAFAQCDNEINFWVRRLREKGFMETGFPNLNSYLTIMACFGIPGLFMYLLPILYLVITIYKIKKYIFKDFGFICATIAFCGQIACLLSNHFMYTYPIVLATIVSLLSKDKQASSIKE